MKGSSKPLSCEERIEIAQQFIWGWYINDEDLCQVLYLTAIEANECCSRRCLMRILDNTFRKYHEEEKTRDIQAGLLEEEILRIILVKEFAPQKNILDILSEVAVCSLRRDFPNMTVRNNEEVVILNV